MEIKYLKLAMSFEEILFLLVSVIDRRLNVFIRFPKVKSSSIAIFDN